MSIKLKVQGDSPSRVVASTPRPGKTDEQIEDLIAKFLQAAQGSAISITHDDANDEIIIDTSGLTEEEVEDTVNSLISDGNAISTTYDDQADTLTIDVSESDIDHNNLQNSGQSDAHHSRYTDAEAETAINNDADHSATASHAHGDLSGIGSDDHHSRYTDSEAESTINNDADHGSTAPHNYFSGNHSDLSIVTSGQHHSRYADSEAVSAIENEDPLDLQNLNLSGYFETNNLPRTLVPVTEYGVVGDGTNDDTTEFNNAFSNEDAVYIPPTPDSFIVTDSLTIPNDTMVFAAGEAAPIRVTSDPGSAGLLDCASSCNVFNVRAFYEDQGQPVGDWGPMVRITGNHTRIHNASLDGGGQAAKATVEIVEANDAKIYNVISEDPNKGIITTHNNNVNSVNGRIVNSYIFNSASKSLDLTVGQGQLLKWDIRGFRAEGCDGLEIGGLNHDEMDIRSWTPSSKILITANKSHSSRISVYRSSARYAIEHAGRRTKLASNHIDQCDETGLRVNANQAILGHTYGGSINKLNKDNRGLVHNDASYNCKLGDMTLLPQENPKWVLNDRGPDSDIGKIQDEYGLSAGDRVKNHGITKSDNNPINGFIEAQGTTEKPNFYWPPVHTRCSWVDTDDGSGTGLYFLSTDGTWKSVDNRAAN